VVCGEQNNGASAKSRTSDSAGLPYSEYVRKQQCPAA
jgi:hypothetical protein